MHLSRTIVSLSMSSSLLLLASPALAQAEDRAPAVRFTVPASAAHVFRTDINRGGSFSLTSIYGGIGATTEIARDVSVSFRFNYSYDDYRFRGNGNLGSDPWDDIHTVNFGAIVTGALDTDWSLFGGPVFQFAREDGASWSDAFIGGGFIGATYNVSEELTIGGGFGVVSQIEDSARFFPIIVLQWQINDVLSLSTSTASSASGDTGLELVYDLGNNWEAGVGAANRFRRFRLSDDGPTPDGVGQDTSMPIWGRLTYHANEHASISLRAGALVGGRMRLEDEDGRRIAREGYDAAPFVGIFGQLRF
jgi:hypothetical protein